MKVKNIIGCVSILVFCKCSSEEPKKAYNKDWVIDVSAYSGINYSKITSYRLDDYGIVALDDKTALLYGMSNLCSVDLITSAFLSKSKINFATWNVRRKVDGSIQLSGYFSDANNVENHAVGIYDQPNQSVKLISTLKSNQINDPANFKGIFAGEDFLYSHNPNFAPNQDEVYVAKWNFDGTKVWRKNIDLTNKKKIAQIHVVQQEYLLFVSVENGNSSNSLWEVGKLSKNGDVIWQKQLNQFGSIFQLLENSLSDFFVLNTKGISKHDTNGNLIWKNSLSNYPSSYIWGRGTTTNDGGIVVQLLNSKDEESLIKLNERGEIVWEEKYWEDSPKNPLSLFLLESNTKDLFVFSNTGYLTRYKRN